jgi:hypothetical protein
LIRLMKLPLVTLKHIMLQITNGKESIQVGHFSHLFHIV